MPDASCCCRRHLSSDCRHGDDDIYATEKLRTTDYDPDGGYRSTFTGCPFGPDMTSSGTAVDEFPPPPHPLPHHHHHRCLGFYSAGRSSTGPENRECNVGSPVRSFAGVARLQSMTYETTRLDGGGYGVGGGGGGAGFCDSPKAYVEPECVPKKTGFLATAT